MVRDIQLRISLKEEEISDILLKKSAEFLSIPIADITGIKVLRKSIDARKPKIILNYKLSVFIKEALPSKPDYIFEYKDVSKAKPVHIIGFGPAGQMVASLLMQQKSAVAVVDLNPQTVATPKPRTAVKTTWSSPVFSTMLPSDNSRRGENSRPMANNSRATPNSAMLKSSGWVEIQPRTFGPTRVPATK